MTFRKVCHPEERRIYLQTVQGEETWWKVDTSFLRMTKEVLANTP
jgi:hypothetical protein